MAKLKIDSPFFRFMGRLGDLLLLNLLWLVCSLPVVSFGAANTALFCVARKMAAGEDYRVARDFFRSFRQNWREATLAWLILLPLGALALSDLVIGFRTAGASGNVFRGIGIVCCLLWLLVEGYAFPLLARFDYRLSQLFPNALFLSLRNPAATLSSVALFVWFPLLLLRSPDVAIYLLPLWVLLGGALSALIVSALLLPAFRKLEAATAKEDDSSCLS